MRPILFGVFNWLSFQRAYGEEKSSRSDCSTCGVKISRFARNDKKCWFQTNRSIATTIVVMRSPTTKVPRKLADKDVHSKKIPIFIFYANFVFMKLIRRRQVPHSYHPKIMGPLKCGYNNTLYSYRQTRRAGRQKSFGTS